MDMLWHDIRYALRTLAKSPGFTAIAVLTLALGIGANTAIFSVVHAVLLKPLPYPHADRLVMAWERVRLPHYQSDQDTPAPGNFVDWMRDNTVFEGMAAVRYHSFSLTGTGEPLRVEGEGVSANLFSLLGVSPALGRTFLADEDRFGGPHVVLLGYGLWATQFGGDPQIVGQTIRLDDLSYTVLGVMPRGFHFPDPDDELWAPVALSPAELANHGSHYLRVVALLKPQVSLAQAQAQMDGIASRLTEKYPTSNTGVGVRLISLGDQVVGNVRSALLVILGVVGSVLLIVCANLANLLLARASVRHREFAIRASLGATQGRILGQLLTESVLLALLGGLLGLVVASWGVGGLRWISPPASFPYLPRLDEIGVNAPVLLFSLGVSLLAGMVFGIAPALQAARSNPQDWLKDGGRESSGGATRRMRGILIVAETALGVVVLISAGLLLRSFIRLQQIPLGFQPENVLTARIILRGTRYSTLVQRTAFYQQAFERIQALPGVHSVGAITFLPLTFQGRTTGVTIEGQAPPAAGELPFGDFRSISPGYFATMGIPLLRGRDFSWDDTAHEPLVAVVSETMARNFWPDTDAIGRRFKLGAAQENAPWITVVGIVGNVQQLDLTSGARPAMYFSAIQDPGTGDTLHDWVVRATGDPLSLAPAVRSAIWSVDKDLPISRLRTMEEVRSILAAPERFNLLLLGLFACLALILAAVGLYGVTAYSIAQRTREIGIRMALGAQTRDVLWLALSEGAKLVAMGVAIGIAAALALTRLMSSLLYGVGATDPLTFGAVAILLALVALAACYIPARRAARIDPMAALRYE